MVRGAGRARVGSDRQLKSMLYRIIAGNREYQLVAWSIEAVKKAARAKIWEVAPGEKVSIFREDKLIGEATRISIFDEADRKHFGPLDEL
jgi:hypothetical protein